MHSLKSINPLKLLVQFPKYRNNLIEFMSYLQKEHGDAIEFKLGGFSGLFLNRPEYFKHVLVDQWANYPKADRYKVFSPLIGDSIL